MILFAIYINPLDKGEFGANVTNIYQKYVNWGRGLRYRILQLTINKEGRGFQKDFKDFKDFKIK